MNKIFSILILITVCLYGLTSCSNDVESVDIKTSEGKGYNEYLEALRAYKNSEHKAIYAFFDNSNKAPSSRGQHISDVPDSIDVVVLTTSELVEFELQDMKVIQEKKGTKVTLLVDYDQIKADYDQDVKDKLEENPAYVANEFSTVLKEKVDLLLHNASTYAYDGIIAKWYGQSTIYMSQDEKTKFLAYEKIFFDAVQAWKVSNSSKLVTFYGNPQLLSDKSLLTDCRHIILDTRDVVSADQLGIRALQAITNGVPTDRFIIYTTTTSLDSSDAKTGYYGKDRAVTEAAYWVTEEASQFDKAGLAIGDVQNDYYNAIQRYRYVREAINIITPAP